MKPVLLVLTMMKFVCTLLCVCEKESARTASCIHRWRCAYYTIYRLLRPTFWLSTSTTFIVENCSQHQIINPMKDKSTPQIYKYKCLHPLTRLPCDDANNNGNGCNVKIVRTKWKATEKGTSHLYVLFGVLRHTQKAMHREF